MRFYFVSVYLKNNYLLFVRIVNISSIFHLLLNVILFCCCFTSTPLDAEENVIFDARDRRGTVSKQREYMENKYIKRTRTEELIIYRKFRDQRRLNALLSGNYFFGTFFGVVD